MRVALVNPHWTFEGSIYFGCQDPHLPLELGYARQMLEAHGHEARIFDGQMFDIPHAEMRRQLADYRPDMTVLTTAPTYLFWRCAPPELRVPQEIAAAIREVCGLLVLIGPHGSATPETALRKVGADVVVMGEAEEAIVRLAEGERAGLPGIAWIEEGRARANCGLNACRFADQPALTWDAGFVERHRHHHHRFDRAPAKPGAEVEASRGCPYSCTFCAKELFRDKYRRRQLPLLLQEIDALLDQGVEYLYFVDEILLPDRKLLDALAERDVEFGVQTRIDLWKPETIERLGAAGCVSIEAGVESLTPEGRDRLNKDCRVGTDELTERLILAKRHVPFVQANLLEVPEEERAAVEAWRAELQRHGVWANEPVPLFPYPGSPDYRLLWGLPDERAWERAHAHYLSLFDGFSDIQDAAPRPLPELEHGMAR